MGLARSALVSIIGASVALTTVMGSPALAYGDAYSSCSSGGFTGTIRVNGSYGYVSSMVYKINKGTNSGGNRANIGMSDGGTTPSTTWSTGYGYQTNSYYTMKTNYYRSHGGYASVKFTFDKSDGIDPSCSVRINFPS